MCGAGQQTGKLWMGSRHLRPRDDCEEPRIAVQWGRKQAGTWPALAAGDSSWGTFNAVAVCKLFQTAQSAYKKEKGGQIAGSRWDERGALMCTVLPAVRAEQRQGTGRRATEGRGAERAGGDTKCSVAGTAA